VNRNASDREQVRHADRTIKRERELLLSGVREICALPAGRRVFLHLIAQWQPRGQMWQPNELMQRNAALSDAADAVKDLIDAADKRLFPQMLAEQAAQDETDDGQLKALLITAKQRKSEADGEQGEEDNGD
jgi:hypothetical protein